MAKNSAAGLLTSVDSMFTTQEERDNAQRSYLTDIPAAEISDFPNHPFHVRMDEEMERLVDSVKERGVLSPVLVRPMPDGGYQMVSGHRRKRAAELAELTTLSCIVRELTDDEATIIMVDSNLQREQVLPSEKAFAYKMKLEAMRRQAGRPSKENLTPSVSDKKLRVNEELGVQVGESREQIRRYIRLTNLLPELLNMVDNSVLKESGVLQMALRPAVELSYLSEAEQRDLLETMSIEDCTPSHAQAIKLREDYPDNKLTGAEFDVYRDSNGNKEFDAGDELVGALTEASTGVYEMDGVEFGGYFVKERTAPEGFYLDENAYYFEITEHGELVTVENKAGEGFVNAAQVGSLKIVKTSSDKKVEGFSFRVTGPNGYEQVFTTNADGEILIEGLRIGEYQVSEVLNEKSANYVLPADKTAGVLADSVTTVQMHNELRDTPKTGDDSNPMLWAALMGVSVLGAGACGVVYVKTKKKENVE